MKWIALSTSSWSMVARTSGVEGLTCRNGPSAVASTMCGPRAKHAGRRWDGVRQRNGVDVRGRIPGNVRRDAVELVEPVRRRQALQGAAQVPLAEDGRGVASALE